MDVNGSALLEPLSGQHYQFLYVVSGIVCSVICVIGVLTNLTNVAILGLMIRSSSTATSIFLFAMAFFDLGILLVYITYSITCIILPPKPIAQELDIPLDYIGTFSYSLFYLWHIPANFFLITSNWCMVSLMVFRFLAVYFPLKAYKLCSIARTKLTLVAVATFAVVSMIPDFFTIQIVDTTSYGKIILYNYKLIESEVFDDLYYNYLEAVNSYLPFIICFTVGGFLVKALHKSMTLLRENSSANRETRRMNDQRRISIMLLAISLWFLICTAPSVVFRCLRHAASVGSSEDGSNWFKLRAVADVCHLFYCSSNLFLYALTNRAYRKQLYNIILQLNCLKGHYNKYMRGKSFRSSNRLSTFGWSRKSRQKTTSTDGREPTVHSEHSTMMHCADETPEEKGDMLPAV